MHSAARLVTVSALVGVATSGAVAGCRSATDSAPSSFDASQPYEPRLPAGPTVDYEEVDAAARCGWLQPDAPPQPDAGTVPLTPAQAACEGTNANPLECPATEPASGSPCTVHGLVCAYSGTGVPPTIIMCGATGRRPLAWDARDAVNCGGSSCPGAVDAGDAGNAGDAGDAGKPLAACGSMPELPCADPRWAVGDTRGVTEQDRVQAVLREVGNCCGKDKFESFTVSFAGGCATSITAASFSINGGAKLTACVERLLAGRRLSCARTVSCASEEGWRDP